mgnify:FL=1
MFITSAELAHKRIFDESDTAIFYIDKGKVTNIEDGGN